MAKDHYIHLYTSPDVKVNQVELSHRETIIVATGDTQMAVSSLDESNNVSFEKVFVTQRWDPLPPRVLYRRIG